MWKGNRTQFATRFLAGNRQVSERESTSPTEGDTIEEHHLATTMDHEGDDQVSSKIHRGPNGGDRNGQPELNTHAENHTTLNDEGINLQISK